MAPENVRSTSDDGARLATSPLDGARPAALPLRALAAVATAQLVILFALSSRYGYHRDELYFRVLGRHLSWGYVDQPPLTVALGRAGTQLLGDTLPGLRAAPTLMACAATFMVALIARELGARSRAQVVAAALAMTGGYTLAVSHMLSTSTADLLAWLAIGWTALRLLRTNDPRWFVLLGLLAGVGVLNKFLVLFMLGTLLVGLLVCGPRRLLRSPWLAAGVVVAAVVMSPTIWWQAQHGWPQLDVARGLASDDGESNRIMLLPNHALLVGPLLVPVWLTGLLRLLRDESLRWARPVAVAYLTALFALAASGGKFYYLLPLLLLALAAGVDPVLGWLAGRHLQRTAAISVAISVAFNAAIALPVVSGRGLALANAVNREQGAQVGWPSFVDQVGDAWQRIPAARRDRAVVLTSNYGEAGALDRFGAARGLPRAFSGHMSLHSLGPPADDLTGPILYVHPRDAPVPDTLLGCRREASIELGLDTAEQGALIELCTSTTGPWSAIWPGMQRFS